MPYIRALHVNKYNYLKGRFNSDSFRNHQGGISIIDFDCAVKASNSICNHLAKYYSHILSEPAFFCIFDFEEIVITYQQANEAPIIISPSQSDKGDECHYNIINFKDKLTDKFSKEKFKTPNLYVCCGDNYRALTSIEFSKLEEFECA
jgi:hypothetical protein